MTAQISRSGIPALQEKVDTINNKDLAEKLLQVAYSQYPDLAKTGMMENQQQVIAELKAKQGNNPQQAQLNPAQLAVKQPDPQQQLQYFLKKVADNNQQLREKAAKKYAKNRKVHADKMTENLKNEVKEAALYATFDKALRKESKSILSKYAKQKEKNPHAKREAFYKTEKENNDFIEQLLDSKKLPVAQKEQLVNVIDKYIKDELTVFDNNHQQLQKINDNEIKLEQEFVKAIDQEQQNPLKIKLNPEPNDEAKRLAAEVFRKQEEEIAKVQDRSEVESPTDGNNLSYAALIHQKLYEAGDGKPKSLNIKHAADGSYEIDYFARDYQGSQKYNSYLKGKITVDKNGNRASINPADITGAISLVNAAAAKGFTSIIITAGNPDVRKAMLKQAKDLGIEVVERNAAPTVKMR